MNNSRLSKPITIGNLKLHHRIGMASLTRFRASDDHVPVDMMTEYYGQRSSVVGTLLISEGTLVSQADSGMDNVPGIWNPTQVDAWRKITDRVHANGCYIICQLWAFGRAAIPEVMAREGFPVIGPDAIPMDSSAPTPQRLSTSGVREKIQDYVNAAKNAIAAGFDGVEIHGAGGFLVDQFTQDVSNQRNDEYGGSIENRSCFAVELTKAIADAIGSDKVGIRLSPFGTFQGMGMRDPIPQFSDLITKLGQLKLAYLHLVEARIRGTEEIETPETPETLDFAYDLWDRTFLINGGYKVDSAQRLVDVERPDKDIVVVFGRYFISTPDLPFRVLRGLEFTPYNRATFYHAKSAEGYIDYPFSPEFLQQSSQQQIVYRASWA
ncbi:hypothetical protein ACET3X_009989 [Alternaria dauci]|uniref:NADH:flavin oxidoreductase/NADH oxidase N-terminal domain-containing protein n=1 Tax=Alternaria dauci TaxID=48095 RepID=A0ABR3U8E3_9PLEO